MNFSTMRDEVILVDQHDRVTGKASKKEAHKKGLLHRAFSVWITNSQGEILLQQRAQNKYHSPGLWSNSCCSHPQPGEETLESAKQRLFEEMRIDSHLDYAGKFYYKVQFETDLAEHEIDHVFTGVYDGPVDPNPNEVADFKWVRPANLIEELEANPQQFTFWFPKVMKMVTGDRL